MPEPIQTNQVIPDPKNQNLKPNDSRKDIKSLTADEYLAALKKQKENSVPKEEYEHLKAEHSKLVQDLADGKNNITVDTSKPETVPTKDLMKKILTDKNMSNLEYVETALKMRKQMLEEGKPDPFAPLGYRRPTTRDEADTAERVAKQFQECVDGANGDPAIFNEILRSKLR